MRLGYKLSYIEPVSYTHLRAHETVLDLVCRLLLEKKNKPYHLIIKIITTTNKQYLQLSSLTTLHTITLSPYTSCLQMLI
ncbi:hypothetical protein PVA38_00895 [Streptococcus pneumoniae D39]|nr:hypothetical protein PVA38_00895 [Streptococcus pneumoniae D39]